MRVLERDYPRYNQLLRIEPGVSQYDWLVQRYLEAQTRATKDGDTTLTHNVGVADTGTITEVDDTTHTIEDDGTIVDQNAHGHIVATQNGHVITTGLDHSVTKTEDDGRDITVENRYLGGKTTKVVDPRKQIV